jgi:phage terminase small subunit
MHGLVVCAQDNIKRVMDFLITQEIMREGGEDPEMHKLWCKSWDTIGAFFKDMKA